MSDLTKLRSDDNLRRAWRWIRSNADANYKSYFRELYQHFAIAEEGLILDLADRLKREIYEPEHSCKLFSPKPSGILRPITLLTVEDQIVYQAAINLVAERLHPKVRNRYLKEVFGHLYAGVYSTWFYKKWSEGYKAFNDASRAAFESGFTYTASFDLTACYDSLDHGVLSHFLRKLGLDDEFCRTLTGWLERWTATEKGIFHGHGIPQGPLSSGLLSEVVLSHFDTLKLTGVKFRYLRYVDDIRLYAKNERDLRRLLVSLDLMSKDIGLFPQSGKIEIHKITDIEQELKTVSNPPEPSIKPALVNQDRLRKRIVELTPRFKISDVTRFKYLLAHAQPSANLSTRLWRILEHHPELYRNVANYLRRYTKIPAGTAEKVFAYIRSNSLYESVRAEFISSVDGKLPPDVDRKLASFIQREVWVPRGIAPDLQVACAKYLIRCGRLAPSAVSGSCASAKSWWARAKIIDAVDLSTLGNSIINSIIDNGVKDRARDVALSSSWKGFQGSYVPAGRRRTWNKAAELLFVEVGAIKRSIATECGISHAFKKYDIRIVPAKWRRFFGVRYAQAERQAIEAVSASGVNVSNFVNVLDVFNDLLLDALYRADASLGTYKLGQIGTPLHAPTGRLAVNFPKVYGYCQYVHSLRYESLASHPLIKSSGKPTKRISYKQVPKVRVLLYEAFKELRSKSHI